MKINYLNVDVYRHPEFDCTNNGISSRFTTLALACPDGPWSFDADKETPLNFCMIERRNLGFASHVAIYPAAVGNDGKIVKRPGWWMFGGNIAHASDSRFSDMSGHYYPLCIHDRRE